MGRYGRMSMMSGPFAATSNSFFVLQGIDKTVKIWDFSLPNLSTKAVRTLHASQPVQCVAWHPTIPTEVASSPIPAFGSEDHPSASGFSRLAGVTEAQAIAAWKNEIDIWDTRTPYLPKMTIKTDEPVNGQSPASLEQPVPEILTPCFKSLCLL